MGEARPVCPRCERPLRACLCAWARPVANRVRIGLWQHPDEVAQAKNSARLLWLSLAACERHAPTELAAPLPASWLAPGAALLYPSAQAASCPVGDGAAAVVPAAMPPVPAAPVHTLIVIDGTWRQSRVMLRAQPALAALPRVALPDAVLAAHGQRYRVRKAHQPGQLSTLEAVLLALGELEGDAAPYSPLMQAFDDWVSAQLQRRPAEPGLNTPR